MAPTLRCALGVPHRNVRQERATNEQSSVFHGSFTGDRIINALHICRAQCLELSHLCLMIVMTGCLDHLHFESKQKKSAL